MRQANDTAAPRHRFGANVAAEAIEGSSMISKFSTGLDMHEVMLTQAGYVVPNLLVEGFQSGQEPDGTWSGSIALTRTSGELEFVASRDPVFWIITKVKEMDGSRTGWIYPEATIIFQDAGSWAPDKIVVQRISFTCKQRVFSL